MLAHVCMYYVRLSAAIKRKMDAEGFLFLR